MGRGIPTALLGRKLKTGAHANRTDAGKAPVKVEAPKVEAPKAEAPKAEAEAEVSMDNTKAELITAAKKLGLETKGLTKAQLLAAIKAS
jgi:hypothetical protein